MKIVGIVAEYNPYHTGHRHHIEEAKRLSGADYCVVVMSPSFVQRGEPAIYDEYTRARMAVLGGADLVLSMPVPFATAAAGDFASCGVSVLASAGCDAISFGSECGDIGLLANASRALIRVNSADNAILKEALKKGLSYPAAREAAVLAIAPELKDTGILSSPNDILGIEYLTAILANNLSIEAYAVPRVGAGYHGKVKIWNQVGISDCDDVQAAVKVGAACHGEAQNYPSAEQIRRLLASGAPEDLASAFRLIPPESLEALAGEPVVFAEDLSALLSYRILTEENPASFAGLSGPLADRIRDMGPGFRTFGEWCSELKTRQLTYTSISRALLHLLLGIRTDEYDAWHKDSGALFTRILAFRRDSADLLHELKKRTGLPLITKTADAPRLLSGASLKLFECDVRASHVYQQVRAAKGGTFRNVYRQSPVIV